MWGAHQLLTLGMVPCGCRLLPSALEPLLFHLAFRALVGFRVPCLGMLRLIG